MLNQINVVYLVIWAIAIGLAAAFIYTNTQRTALSLFITKLIEKGCFDENSALNLSDLCLGKTQMSIVKNACLKHYGLKRIIVLTEEKNKTKVDDLSNLLHKKKSYKYHLNTTETEEILKKYSFKGMPLYQILLFTIALLLTAFLLTKAYDMFYDYVYVPNVKDEVQTDEELNNQINPPSQFEDDKTNQDEDIIDDVIPDTPTTPTIPTIPTLPTKS